jgi:hypothetical protein
MTTIITRGLGRQARIGSLGAGKEWFKPWRTGDRPLFTIAGVILAGMITVVVFVIDKRNPTGAYWLLVTAAIGLLILSCVQGARGLERLHAENPHFNWQAVDLSVGFFVFLTSFFFLGPEKPDQNLQEIGRIQREFGAISADLGRAKQDLAKVMQDQTAAQVEMQRVRSSVQALTPQHPPEGTKSTAHRP